MIQRPAGSKETLSEDVTENDERQEVEPEDENLQNLSLNEVEDVLEERNESVNQLEEVELNIPEESNPKFECEKCGKKFVRKYYAKVHCKVNQTSSHIRSPWERMDAHITSLESPENRRQNFECCILS